LALTNVQLSDTGDYTVLVTNAVSGPAGVLSAAAHLEVLADSDGDRMPDLWEMAHGLDENDPADGDEDADGDGANNRDEYLAGTDPGEAASVFRVETVWLGAEGVELEFLAVSNRSYSVLYAEGPAAFPWIKLADLTGQPTNRWEKVTDPFRWAARRIYRLVTPRVD